MHDCHTCKLILSAVICIAVERGSARIEPHSRRLLCMSDSVAEQLGRAYTRVDDLCAVCRCVPAIHCSPCEVNHRVCPLQAFTPRAQCLCIPVHCAPCCASTVLVILLVVCLLVVLLIII